MESDEQRWERLRRLETALTNRTDYTQSQRFQRLIARYQMFLGLLITLFAFFLGYGSYYLAAGSAGLAIIVYWQYEREWDKSKQDTVRLWEIRDQKEINTTLKMIRARRRKGGALRLEE